MNPSILEPLKRRCLGDVLLDERSRERYSTAECIYRIRPLGAVLPAGRDDLLEVLRLAGTEGIPVTARGAGSAVAGQSLGRGLIVDFSRHFRRVREVNREERWARVEPGVVLSELNRDLTPSGLRFLPDPSSEAVCTLGGMIANNAGGARSVRFGPTRDQVISLTVALADGTVFETRPIRRTGCPLIGPDRQSELAEGLTRIVDPAREEIRRVTPRVRRSSSGYELLRSVGEEVVDLAPLLVGSEGTLALILEAKVRLVPRPGASITALLPFRNLDALGEGVAISLLHLPSAVEALDRSFLDLVREAGQEDAASLPADTEAVLIVEMERDDETEAEAAMQRLLEAFGRTDRPAGSVIGRDPRSRERLWDIRKAASPILAAREGALRSTRFIEDACVPPPRLPDLLREVRRILREHHLPGAIFGHAGDALLHVNPQLDPSDPDLADRMETVAEEHADMILSLGGSLTGEHGDGRLRTPLLKKAYGAVTGVHRAVKDLFDPAGLLNPGIKVHDGHSRLVDDMDLRPRDSEPNRWVGREALG